MGMSWYDLLALWMQQQAIKDNKPKGDVSYTMPDWLKPIMDKYAGALNYTPTRDYVSSYVHNYLQGANAPGGVLDYKPTFQTQYMAGNQLPSFPKIDMSKGVFSGDKNGMMPWNYGYTGPGIGGAAAKPPGGPVGPKGNPIGGPGAGGGRGGFQQDPGQLDPWSPDYSQNPYNPKTPGMDDPFGGGANVGGNAPRNEYGLLVTAMNSNSPQAQQQWNQWFGGLTPEQRTAELQRARALDKVIIGLGSGVASYVTNAVKKDPLGFGAALFTAAATGGASLVAFLATQGVQSAAGSAWDSIVNGVKSVFGGATAQPPAGSGGGGNGNPSPPPSPWRY